jgi:tetratricopeptide (TPR) repeat protein
MKKIVCEVCGSNDLIKKGDNFVCNYCGTKYTLESMQQMLGTVKIDKSDSIDNYFELARRAKNNNDVKTALKYYEMILEESPNNWEAYFYSIYFNAKKNSHIEINPSKIQVMKSNIKDAILLIEKIDDTNKRHEAIEEATIKIIEISNIIVSNYNEQEKIIYNNFKSPKERQLEGINFSNKKLNVIKQNYINHIKEVSGILFQTADFINNSDKFNNEITQNDCLKLYKEIENIFFKNAFYTYKEMLRVDSTISVETQKCYMNIPDADPENYLNSTYSYTSSSNKNDGKGVWVTGSIMLFMTIIFFLILSYVL